MTKFKILSKIKSGAEKLGGAILGAKSTISGMKADNTRKLVKQVRAEKGAANFRNGQPTDAFKRRTVLEAEIDSLKKKASK